MWNENASLSTRSSTVKVGMEGGYRTRAWFDWPRYQGLTMLNFALKGRISKCNHAIYMGPGKARSCGKPAVGKKLCGKKNPREYPRCALHM